MIFKLNGRKSIDFEQGSIAKAFLVLGNGQSIPDVSVVNNIVIIMQGKMTEDRPSKMCGARQKILREVLRDAGDIRPLDHILLGKQAIVRRQQVYIKLAIDQTANVMQNMRGCALWAGYDVEGSIEDAFHCWNYKLGARTWMH